MGTGLGPAAKLDTSKRNRSFGQGSLLDSGRMNKGSFLDDRMERLFDTTKAAPAQKDSQMNGLLVTITLSIYY